MSYFSEESILENFTFGTKIGTDLDKLKEVLIKNGCTHLIPSMNPNGFDINSYQVAYDSGWPNPEYAAYLLGKSSNYLAKKRMEDKKKITQQSIPFKGENKDIQYPVDRPGLVLFGNQSVFFCISYKTGNISVNIHAILTSAVYCCLNIFTNSSRQRLFSCIYCAASTPT